MSLDLSKLTPAPWRKAINPFGSPDGKDSLFIIEADGSCVATVPDHPVWLALNAYRHTNADFIALARNAFDVMMRRPWGVDCVSWSEVERQYEVTDETGRNVWHKLWPDPFTALIEADKWYMENIDNQPKEPS